MWANHVWNMFDFAADARDQGGEPGMNHKGLVTFDRKTKKDSFYLYKAWWSSDRFVHICSKRFVDRCGKKTTIKVYSTDDTVTLMVNGKTVGKKTSSDHVLTAIWTSKHSRALRKTRRTSTRWTSRTRRTSS